MGQKKSNKVIIILIIVVLIFILLCGVAYAYFATDLFKGNKQLFFKYITQIGDEQEGFIDSQLMQYFEKQKNTPYSDEGSMSVNITAEEVQEELRNVNQMNVTFDGQVDSSNSKVTQNISLNYSDEVKFPIIYKKIGDVAGIQTDYIGSKFVTTDLSSESSLIEDVEGIEKLEEFSNVELTQEEINRIKDTYINVLNQELPENSFSKIEEQNSKGYRLTLTGENIKNILVKVLETFKNDQATLEKINEYLKIQRNSSKITVNDIEDIIDDINQETEFSEQNIEITVYQSNRKTNKITIKVDEIEIKIEKNKTANDIQYNVELQVSEDNETIKFMFIMKVAGLQSMQSVTENYELALETEEVRYQYNYNNNVEFTDNVDIEEFNDDNSLNLEELEEEQRNTFLEAVEERIDNVNKDHMDELGLEEDENPLQYAIPQIGIYSSAVETIDNLETEEIATEIFNSKFENYAGTNIAGVTVKGLFSTIQLNNESNEEDEDRQIKEIHFDGEEYEATSQNITILKSSVELETQYRVEFEKDENTGLIYRAVINKK